MGSGFAFDSIKSTQYNRMLKQMKRVRYNEMKDAVSKIKSKYHVFIDRNKLTEIELKKYKRKVKSKIRKDKQMVFFKSISITIIIGIIIIYITKFLYNLFINSF